MQIVFLTSHFAPHFEGGTELVARAQAAALVRRGHHVRVISGTDRPRGDTDREYHSLTIGSTGSTAGDETARVTATGELEVVFMPRSADEAYDLELARPRLARLVEAEVGAADIVHVHHWSTLTGSIVRDLAPGRPVVLTLHDLFVTCPRFFRVPVVPVADCPPQREDEHAGLEVCARCIAVDAPGIESQRLVAGLGSRAEAFQAELRAASRIIVPSHSHLETLGRFVDLPAAGTSVVPHGLCAPLAPRGSLDVPREFTAREPLRILFLGHRSSVKGVTDLVDALAGLEPGLRARVHLVLLGTEVQDGFDRELEERAAGLSLYLGDAYRAEDLGAQLEAAGGAHLAALPSRVRESYGLVVDEAMGLGLPVWVSSLGAPKERVGKQGKVLPPRDPETWRKAFVGVLEAPDTLLGDRRTRQEPSRTAQDAARELEQIYTGLVGGL